MTLHITGLGHAQIKFNANLGAGLFVLFVFLPSTNGGQWAERYETVALILRATMDEIIIMVLGALAH